MLKSLATLVKIYKAQLDKKRKELSILLDSKQRKIDEIKWYEESIRAEGENVKNLQEEFRPMFLAYISAVRIKEGLLLEEIDQLNPQISKMTDEISLVFSEMKKYEIVKENREEEMALELQRKTQIEIDEMAIMNFVRKSEFEYYN